MVVALDVLAIARGSLEGWREGEREEEDSQPSKQAAGRKHATTDRPLALPSILLSISSSLSIDIQLACSAPFKIKVRREGGRAEGAETAMGEALIKEGGGREGGREAADMRPPLIAPVLRPILFYDKCKVRKRGREGGEEGSRACDHTTPSTPDPFSSFPPTEKALLVLVLLLVLAHPPTPTHIDLSSSKVAHVAWSKEAGTGNGQDEAFKRTQPDLVVVVLLFPLALRRKFMCQISSYTYESSFRRGQSMCLCAWLEAGLVLALIVTSSPPPRPALPRLAPHSSPAAAAGAAAVGAAASWGFCSCTSL
jgi:hypothetical protein